MNRRGRRERRERRLRDSLSYLENSFDIIEEILGGGGFGVTYRAQNPKEAKAVAIKTLNANVQGKSNFRELQTKFVNEALSLAKCSHPHVVQVYEVFPETVGNIELWCMVMELIDGIDLASHLEDNGIMSEAGECGDCERDGVGTAKSIAVGSGMVGFADTDTNISN
jgi:serine/threonine protein kinase